MPEPCLDAGLEIGSRPETDELGDTVAMSHAGPVNTAVRVAVFNSGKHSRGRLNLCDCTGLEMREGAKTAFSTGFSTRGQRVMKWRI